ncbi:hypothetical protein VNO77_03942 [Canavalia gladiata]|uniref:Uncharacterized protein n=1 Tax=Canavalia gladiata TaxID=3824 RepID=A0AAN9MXP4_CANGL
MAARDLTNTQNAVAQTINGVNHKYNDTRSGEEAPCRLGGSIVIAMAGVYWELMGLAEGRFAGPTPVFRLSFDVSAYRVGGLGSKKTYDSIGLVEEEPKLSSTKFEYGSRDIWECASATEPNV